MSGQRFPPPYQPIYNQNQSSPKPCHCGVAGCYNDWNVHMWAERLLPFMEGTTIYNKIDFNSPIFSPWTSPCPPVTYTSKNSGCATSCACATGTPAAQVIPAFVCPSAPRTENPFTETTQGWQCSFHHCCFVFTRLNGANDYQGLCGWGNPLKSYWVYGYNNGVCPPSLNGRGMFNDTGDGWAIENILDGTSTTMFVAEIAGRPNWWTKGGSNGLVNHGLPTKTAETPIKGWFGDNPGGCWACWENKGKCPSGSSFCGLSKPSSSSKTTVIPVCFLNCTNENGVNVGFSFHPGCVGMVMCDGSAPHDQREPQREHHARPDDAARARSGERHGGLPLVATREAARRGNAHSDCRAIYESGGFPDFRQKHDDCQRASRRE